ncbi:MAG: DUF4037 domain-containing protein [Lachnospiraceae bacterium]|nr:DUF4037 domain-containing protein [Lachnospiraceae bacterium]
MQQESARTGSRRFYENQVAALIKERFTRYESRIAVGIAGEGSDCFGYDDFMSRDHDFGTGVCLWLTDDAMDEFGEELAAAYDELVATLPGANLTSRLAERRGVMTVHDFYSGILGIDCDTAHCTISDKDWQALDHSCLATAVNGEIFKDDEGELSRFRRLLLQYYPDHIWRIRIANELHRFSAAMQVNYARCMTRGDIVAARLCHMEGLKSAMELFFLMKREYPPYYKWTYRRLAELDENGAFLEAIREFSRPGCEEKAWEGRIYEADRLNRDDQLVCLAEIIASHIVDMMNIHGLIHRHDPYLELYVDEVLRR